jgi:hypothetical protein
MYLLARQGVVRSLDAEKWAVEIGAAAAKGIGNDVGVWATVLSPGVGTFTWTSRWENLAGIEKGFAELMGDEKYLALAAEGLQMVTGPLNDALYETVYHGSGLVENARYASTITAVCAPGNFAKGMLSGIEIAQRAEKASGVPVEFVAGQTGAYGTVSWIAGYETIEAFETAQHKLTEDISFVEYLDSVTGAYQADPTLTQTTLYMRLN